MMNKLGLIIVSVILALIQTGCAEQSTWMSLNSSNPRIIWEVKPQADLENITGEQISTRNLKCPITLKVWFPELFLLLMLKQESFLILIMPIIFIK